MNTIVISLTLILQIQFSYTIGISGVTDFASAKEITDPLREEFKTFPTFNDSTDLFEFNSWVDIDSTELSQKLNQYGYSINYYKKK